MTRRQLLARIGMTAGGAMMYQAMSSLGMAAESTFTGPLQLDGDAKGASVLILGAGLAGMGERVRAITGLPVWDCVEAAQQSLQHTLAPAGRRAAVA